MYLGPPPLQTPQCGCPQCHPPEMKCKNHHELIFKACVHGLRRSSPTQVSNMSSARSFLRVGLAAQENTINHHMKGITHLRFIQDRLINQCPRLPPVFCYEFHQLLLCVRFSWNGERFLHERFIEIDFVQLQGQLFGHLWWQKTSHYTASDPQVCLFGGDLQIYQTWQRT